MSPMNIAVAVFLAAFSAGTLVSSARAADAPSPENQVFQFAQNGTCSKWPDRSTSKASAYLWIPESCQQVRGLVIMCTNVPEHRLVGDPRIRKVCADNNLAIVWCVPSFMNFKFKNEQAVTVAFLQELLDGLAKSSGYAEIATVPWLPMGESGHLLMVDALVEQQPKRCIAAVFMKNPHLPPKNRTVPTLVYFGTAQEWGQEKGDFLARWKDTGHYAAVLKERAQNPDWAFTYVMDGHSGHFDVDDRSTDFYANYIAAACRARLPEQIGEPLKKIDLNTGVVADLPLPGRAKQAAIPFAKASNDQRAAPWFFDNAAAEAAQGISGIDWSADSVLPAMLGADGAPLPFALNGINILKAAQFEPDGITFSLKAQLLDKLPSNFKEAGRALPTPPGPVTIDWLCGPIVPLGDGRFRIALDRSWPSAACYVAMRHPGGPGVRAVVQPCNVDLKSMRNAQGEAQTLDFSQPSDMNASDAPQPLKATSSAGLPVGFYVESGPATIENGAVKLASIPPRSRLPITVTVAAWQWGRAGEKPVKMADIVRRTFQVSAAR